MHRSAVFAAGWTSCERVEGPWTDTGACATEVRKTGGVNEEVLSGGVANVGRVVRIGSRVHRPAGPHAASIFAFLRSLDESGFDGASVPEGFDDGGREVLTFIEGDVVAPPYPEWVQSNSALGSIADLIARMHRSSAGFDHSGCDWSDELADPEPDPGSGTVMCHNDVCLENIVFRDGRAIGLVDFDYAAPGRAVDDLAQFAKMCVPLDRPEGLAGLDGLSQTSPAGFGSLRTPTGSPAMIDWAFSRRSTMQWPPARCSSSGTLLRAKLDSSRWSSAAAGLVVGRTIDGGGGTIFCGFKRLFLLRPEINWVHALSGRRTARKMK